MVHTQGASLYTWSRGRAVDISISNQSKCREIIEDCSLGQTQIKIRKAVDVSPTSPYIIPYSKCTFVCFVVGQTKKFPRVSRPFKHSKLEKNARTDQSL